MMESKTARALAGCTSFAEAPRIELFLRHVPGEEGGNDVAQQVYMYYTI